MNMLDAPTLLLGWGVFHSAELAAISKLGAAIGTKLHRFFSSLAMFLIRYNKLRK